MHHLYTVLCVPRLEGTGFVHHRVSPSTLFSPPHLLPPVSHQAVACVCEVCFFEVIVGRFYTYVLVRQKLRLVLGQRRTDWRVSVTWRSCFLLRMFLRFHLNIHQDIPHVLLISENFDILCVYTLKHSLIQFAI